MLSLLNNIILILCNLAPDPPVSSVTKDQPLGGEGRVRGPFGIGVWNLFGIWNL